MRIAGFVMLALGTIVMAIALLFLSPYRYIDETERLTTYINRGDYTRPHTDMPDREYRPERAQARQLVFGGGAVLFLAGAVFVAGGRRRKGDNAAEA